MSRFSPNHARVLATGFLDIHGRLQEMEAFLAGREQSSVFSEHAHDISPTEAKVIQDYFARIRSTMLACLQENEIPLEVHRTSLRWTLQTRIEFLHVAIAELGPAKLRGYGTMSPAVRDELVRIQQELGRLVDRVSAYLRQGLGQDLSQRLARLEASSGTVETLKLVNRVVARWQLVEFRPLIDAMLQRIEHPRYEIAVFGRVNSGKSSLLNHVVGMDVLPVGVTPITAVPTRLVRGDRALAVIQFAERGAKRISLDELSQYASEEGNPDNKKHVTGITVHVPFPRLHEGVVLVDTPGIGSLALAGGVETLAYLPRCDLGVLLIDAATALNEDDLAVLRGLYEAGIPAHVLVSKADLLSPADQDRTKHYVRQHIQRELNLDLQVHPVSTVRSHEALLARWFEHEIEPLFQRQRALAEKSLQRKIAHLRESVIAVLQTIASRHPEAGEANRADLDAQRAGQLLSQADNAILRTKEQCRDWSLDGAALVAIILQDAAQALVQSPKTSKQASSEVVVRVIRDVLLQRAQMARQAVTGLQQSLRRALETIQEIAGLAGTDIAPVRDFVCSEQPILVLSGLREKCHPAAPWWRTLLPRWAASVLRGWLKKRLGPTIQEFVNGYNEQLEVWMKGRMVQLTEAYQSQAEVLREQVRRIKMRSSPAGSAEDMKDLTHDLRELQKNDESEEAAMVPTTPP